MRLYQSIYETALRNQVPRPVIEELIRIYSYDVDFQRKVRPAIRSRSCSPARTEGSEEQGRRVVRLADHRRRNQEIYRYQTADDNVVDYYDETGKSAKKFLVRKPVGDGHHRSRFGSRHHPMLGYSKMHTGVDWARRSGRRSSPPAMARSKGRLGRRLRQIHPHPPHQRLQTAYGHMSAFARDMEPGTRVRQGQLIGYVGSTGLSTGAHCTTKS